MDVLHRLEKLEIRRSSILACKSFRSLVKSLVQDDFFSSAQGQHNVLHNLIVSCTRQEIPLEEVLNPFGQQASQSIQAFEVAAGHAEADLMRVNNMMARIEGIQNVFRSSFYRNFRVRLHTVTESNAAREGSV